MYDKILVPIDGSETSARGLEEAIQLAQLTGARIRLIHIVDELMFTTGIDGSALIMGDVITSLKEAGQACLDKALTTTKAAGISADGILVEGFGTRVSDTVVEQANRWGAQLIVLGTHGRKGVSRLVLGSDAEQILRVSPVPVLLVRARTDHKS